MSRYTTKLQNIQEANARLEQRLLNEQTAPKAPSPKYINLAKKINANASKIRDAINAAAIPNEPQTSRDAKRLVSNLAGRVVDEKILVTPQELANIADDFAKKNGSKEGEFSPLDTVIKIIDKT